MEAKIRCFIAIDIENPEIIGRLTSLSRDLTGTGVRMRTVAPENLHLTLAFIGEIPHQLVKSAEKALEEIHFSKFNITIAGVGAFPSVARPRVIWVGVKEGAENTIRLAEEVRRKLREYRVPFDSKPFVPHITVARVKGPSKPTLTKLLNKMEEVTFGIQEVEAVKLKKSVLTSKGPIYTTLHEKKLD